MPPRSRRLARGGPARRPGPPAGRSVHGPQSPRPSAGPRLARSTPRHQGPFRGESRPAGGIAPRRSARSSGERFTSWEETPSKSPARSCAGRGVRLRRPRTSRPTRKPTSAASSSCSARGTRAGVTPPRRSEHAPLRALALPSLRSSWPAGPCRRRDRKHEGRCLRLRPSPCPGTVGPDRPGEARECPLLLRRRRRGRVPAPAHRQPVSHCASTAGEPLQPCHPHVTTKLGPTHKPLTTRRWIRQIRLEVQSRLPLLSKLHQEGVARLTALCSFSDPTGNFLIVRKELCRRCLSSVAKIVKRRWHGTCTSHVPRGKRCESSCRFPESFDLVFTTTGRFPCWF